MVASGPVRLPLVIELDGVALTDRLDAIEAKVDAILNAVIDLGAAQATAITNLEDIMADLTAITASVTENTSAAQSAVTLLNQLGDLIEANATDPAALQALADQLHANSQALADAVVANTPAAP